MALRCGYSLDPKVTQLMRVVRRTSDEKNRECLGVISLYDDPRPWLGSLHLAQIYEGMERRAEKLGYRLEPMWLRAPGMTPARFRGILDARGIEGLLCFGSPAVDDTLPGEFDHYAIVAQGMSMKTSVHRVVSNAYGDMLGVLNRLHALGYRRPGLWVSEYEHIRGVYAHLSGYLGWCHHHLDARQAVPVLRTTELDESQIMHWVRENHPDVIISVQRQEEVAGLCSILRRNKIEIPSDIGVVGICQLVDDPGLAGLAENQHLIGACAVELLASRVMTRDFGVPARPRVEMVDGIWQNGATLRNGGASAAWSESAKERST